MLLAFVGARFIPRSAAFLDVQVVGFFAMGLMLVLLPLTLVRDLFVGAWTGVRRLRRTRAPAPAAPASGAPTRRDVLRAASSFGVLGSSSLLTSAGVVEALALPELRRVSIPIDDLPEPLVGFRIVQITDLPPRADSRTCVARGRRHEGERGAARPRRGHRRPRRRHVDDLRDVVEPLGRLRAPRGVFFVTGNHEYYWDAEAWVAHVRFLGLDVLLNEHRVVEVGGACLVVAGVADFSARQMFPAHGSDPKRALEGAPAAGVKLLLAHQPKSVLAARKLGVDLQLSGHTHGGQFFPWNLLVGFFQPLARGLGRFDRTWLYVSPGTGTWGPPVRTGVPSEISVIELERAR
jgi:hypothetical protein